ncbi:HAAS signaling domain-containing protein [Alicyclobacillus ferrooxydans]|uniref:DUF1700 domain-containing protein n=1 Tax=Alicyclobacillus ferrooxydans TaxID=471514 RepID=A0A0P9CF72_9BACL|nr:DUF1700 domain-containing protein [Alicyclobacillus ferrooxydans]KPV44444.1 hypothetical protein AN477_07490 [Alicyclobacillus ferrooxydans]
MTKQEFLRELNRLLARVPVSERREMLYDYEEHIRSAIENGSTEVEAVTRLGNPKMIAKELLATAYVQQAETSTSIPNVLRAVLAVIGLGFFNIVIVLGPFCAVVGVLIALYAVAFSFIIAPIAALIGIIVGSAYLGVLSPLLAIFAMVTVEGVGWLLAVGAISLTRLFGQLCIRYLKLNLRVIEGGK